MRHTVTMGGGSRGIRRAGPARDLEARRLLRRVRHPPQRGLHHRRQPPTAAHSAHAPAPGRPRQSRQTRASVPPTRRPPGVPRPPLPVPQARARGRARAPVTWEAEPSTRRFARDLGSRIGEGHARRSSAPGSGAPPDGGAAGAAIVALAPTRPLTAQRVVRKRQREPVPRGLSSSSARPRFGIVWPIGSLRRRCYRRSRPVHPYSEERRYEYGDAI